jgi:hypothetical protein
VTLHEIRIYNSKSKSRSLGLYDKENLNIPSVKKKNIVDLEFVTYLVANFYWGWRKFWLDLALLWYLNGTYFKMLLAVLEDLQKKNGQRN